MVETTSKVGLGDSAVINAWQQESLWALLRHCISAVASLKGKTCDTSRIQFKRSWTCSACVCGPRSGRITSL